MAKVNIERYVRDLDRWACRLVRERTKQRLPRQQVVRVYMTKVAASIVAAQYMAEGVTECEGAEITAAINDLGRVLLSTKWLRESIAVRAGRHGDLPPIPF
jgi:hypothetical protein